jgi:serine/threonine protein kinase
VFIVAGVTKGTVLAERYRLERKLGEGAMGSVWKAEHLMLGSKVAIKLLDESIAAHSIALARFMREARAAASLKSVHVVQIHDYGVDRKMPYIAMEFLEGETLSDRLRRSERLSPSETALILTHVARGIGKAHETGVIHRDLKPDNIFLLKEDDEQYAKVLDFGVAKAGEGVFAATLTSAGKLLGTPAYMSAEQAAGRPVDHRTDIWALAVIAFECLTGELPFVGDDLPDLLHAIHDGPIPIPSRLGPVPEGFDAWFARGVARNVDDRYYSAKTMIAELRALCGVETVARGSATELADEERQRKTLSPNEEDLPDEGDTTGTRIARAFRAREEEEPPESMYDDIIRTHDVLADSVARPVDDILTDDDFDDAESPETPLTESSPEPSESTDAGADTQNAPPPRSASTSAPPPPNRTSKRPAGRLVSQPPPKPKDREQPPKSEPAPISASRAAASDVRVEFDDPPAATPDPPSSAADRRLSGAETATGTVVSVPPRRSGQLGLLVAAAIVVVLGTAAGTIAFVLRSPPSEAAPARNHTFESSADQASASAPRGDDEYTEKSTRTGVVTDTSVAAQTAGSADDPTVSPVPSGSTAIDVVPIVGPHEEP